MASKNTDSHSHGQLVQEARVHFDSGATRPLPHRLAELEALNRLFIECEEEILEALRQDMRKSRQEAVMYEVEIVKREIRHMLRNLRDYAAPTRVAVNLLGIFDRAYTVYEPYGVVLVIGTWNYPFLLTCKPAIGALAAGNVVLLKPSEMAPASAAVLASRIPQYMRSCFVLQTDGPRTEALIREHPLDHVFCTSSRPVGAAVLRAAAEQLTPCTLELGGKSPCYIHDSADLLLATKRILWGKLINLGQTCIAPDYILCSADAQRRFVAHARVVLREWYGTRLQGCDDLPRIVNAHHWKRLAGMLSETKGVIAVGGHVDEEDLWIEPTVVIDVEAKDSCMQQEIFGPILPIMSPVESAEEAVAVIQATAPQPLAMYVFSKDQQAIDTMLERVQCGSVCVNDSIWQNAWDGLPFGGVGASGVGKYHGRHSFATFSHRKAVLHRGFSWLSEKLGESRYPPYTPAKVRMFKLIVYNFHHFDVPQTVRLWLGLLLTTTLTFAALLVVNGL